MRKPDGLECLYLDFDSFFASAEQHLQPHLRGRPVGVIPLKSRHTSCIAASREAKRFGIKTGTGVMEAREKCREIVFVVARHHEYVRLHNRIIEIVDSVVPVHGVRSIDEMACHLLKNEQQRAVELAAEIKKRVLKNFSPALTCSIGLAANELLAKIGAEMNKPNGLVTLLPEELPGKITHLKLTDIPGIGEGNAARLSRAGIHTIESLWNIAPKHARALWGSVEGERFWAMLHGYALERPETSRSMFGHSRVLAWDWRVPHKVRDCARLLLVKAARRMRREDFAARTLTLSLRCKGGPYFTQDHRFTTPIIDDHSALEALDHLLCAGFNNIGNAKPKLVHVFLHGLVKAETRRFDLFEEGTQARTRKAWEKLSQLNDAYLTKHNRPLVQYGLVSEPPGGYAGGKIAFSRVPDMRDF